MSQSTRKPRSKVHHLCVGEDEVREHKGTCGAAEDVGFSLLGRLSLNSGQSLLPWLSRSRPPPTHRSWKEVDEVSLLFFFLGAACFAYQRHGHFFYCHISLQYQVFLHKTERDREAVEGRGRLLCFWESELTKQMGLPEFVS